MKKTPKKKLIDPNKLRKLIDSFIEQIVIFPLDKDKEIKEHIKTKIIQYLSKLKDSIEIEIETNQTYKTLNIKEEWRTLNVQINSQLKRAGKPLNELPESEWKKWIIELMNYRDTLTPLVK